MIKLISPRMGRVVSQLLPEHKEFLEAPPSELLPKTEWLDLHREGEDRSFPAPVEFEFEPRTDGRIILTDSRGSTRECPAKQGRARIFNLLAGEKYTWYVRVGFMTSQTESFTTEGDVPRLLSVDGISNVRDLGGYASSLGGRVRQGMVYRSTEANCHYSITESGKTTLIGELGVRTEIDLRGINGESVSAAFDREGVRWVNFPLAAYAEIFTPEQKELYRQSFELLADRDVYPLVAHCWAGMDRTGTWLYVLGALVGIDEGDLMSDYEMSSFSIWGQRSRASATFREFLDAFHAYGRSARTAAENFLADCGVREDTVRKIRDILIEK